MKKLNLFLFVAFCDCKISDGELLDQEMSWTSE